MYFPNLTAEPKRCRKTSSSGECFSLQAVGELHGCLDVWPWPQRWVLPSHTCIFGEQPSPSAGGGECHGMSAWLSDRVSPWNNPPWLPRETWSQTCGLSESSRSYRDQPSLRCNHSKTRRDWSLGMGARFESSGRRIGLVSCFYENHNSFEPASHWL